MFHKLCSSYKFIQNAIIKPFVPGQLVDKLFQLNLKYSFTGEDTSITAEHGIL